MNDFYRGAKALRQSQQQSPIPVKRRRCLELSKPPGEA
jgi:hypothetical protein